MKYVILLGDGMADTPVPELCGKTPLEAACKPAMDRLAREGTVGLARTIPFGMSPGSDVANLSVMGYDPQSCYTGRSPLEAVSLGVELGFDELALRCNLVTLSDEPRYEDKTMVDYSCDEIPTAEARVLIEALAAEFNSDDLRLYPGISYRHCLVLSHTEPGTEMTPPHDITGRPIAGHLPKGRCGDRLLSLMRRSEAILRAHPLSIARAAAGKHAANSVWFWGEGTRPRLESFQTLYGLTGGVVCAVDLVRGIGLCAGLRTVEVEGATGGMVTNYRGKGEAALRLLREGCDLVYIHVEAPDECGHHRDPAAKVRAIESIDRELLSPLVAALEKGGEPFRVLLTPDHPTPIALATHTADPVPFVLWESGRKGSRCAPCYSEAEAAKTGLFLPQGPQLMQKLCAGDF